MTRRAARVMNFSVARAPPPTKKFMSHLTRHRICEKKANKKTRGNKLFQVIAYALNIQRMHKPAR
jgi:hypothetical protein